DIAMMMVQHHSAAEFESRCMDQFERLYEEGAKRLKVMAIAVHPYISGVPHRIKYFENVFRRLRDEPGVEFWTGDQILNWYRRGAKPVKTAKPAARRR
ncbi:MAG: polysaccharide deacetylase, partial [Betaproteobacteria bacterium]